MNLDEVRAHAHTAALADLAANGLLSEEVIANTNRALRSPDTEGGGRDAAGRLVAVTATA